MDKTIENLSNETIETIKNRSAYKLPNNPSERGFKTEDIKGAFWRAEFDGEMSIMGQLKKIVDRLNQILPQTLDNTQIVDNCVTADPSKVASANQLVVLKGLIDSASNEMLDIRNNADNQDLTINSLGSQIDEVENSLSNITSTVQENAGSIESLNNEITNLTQTSGLLYKDEKGVLRVGDAIVSSKKALVSNPTEISIGGTVIYQSDSILGRTFEIEYGLLNGNYPKKFYKFKLSSSGMDFAEIQVIDLYGEFIDEVPVGIGIIASTITNKLQVRALSDVDPNKMCVYSLKEIFE